MDLNALRKLTEVISVFTFANISIYHPTSAYSAANNEITHLISLHSEVYSRESPQIPAEEIYPSVV